MAGLPWQRWQHTHGGTRYCWRPWLSVALWPTGKTSCQGHIRKPAGSTCRLPSRKVVSGSHQWMDLEACPHSSLRSKGFYIGASLKEHLPGWPAPSPQSNQSLCWWLYHSQLLMPPGQQTCCCCCHLAADGWIAVGNNVASQLHPWQNTSYDCLPVTCSYSDCGDTATVWEKSSCHM